MTSLVARENQFSQLGSILKNVLRGHLQIVLVSGESGVGKTALVTAFAEKAKREIPELFAAGSKCHQVAGGQQEPYLPFVQILEALSTEKMDNAIWDWLRQGMAELAPDWLQIVPGVGSIAAAAIRTVQWGWREFDDQGESADISHRMVQYTNTLQLAAKTVPLLLWIDDAHWSDSATLNLISFLVDHASDSRIMLIVAYRPTDIAYKMQGQPHPVKRLINRLKRYQQCIELAVPNFTRADIEQFLTVGGHRFPEDFVERLWRQSGGNPLFATEYMILLHKCRMLKRERGVFVLAQEDVEIEIPGNVQDVIDQRLELIGHDLRQLLSYASVQGERFASCILTQLLETPELDVLEKLNLLEKIHKLIRELEEHRLIVTVGTEYQFVHALIQQVVYNDLSVGQRRMLHRAIAHLLENLCGEDAARYATDLATHFERGGDPARAAHYYLQASRNALAVLALDDALTQAEAARQLARLVGEDGRTTEWHIEALIRTAEAHYWKAEYEATLASCDEGETLCEQGNFAEQHAYFLYWRSRTALPTGHFGNAITPIRQALEILGDAPANHKLQGYLYTGLGAPWNPLSTNEIQQALDTAITIAEEHNLPDVKAEALLRKAWIAVTRTYTHEEVLYSSQKALTIVENYDMVEGQVDCYRLMAVACRRLKRGEEAFSHDRQAVVVARQRGLLFSLHLALQGLAVSWYEVREDLQEGLRVVQEAVALAEQYHFPVNRYVLETWFDYALSLGIWQEAKRAQECLHEQVQHSLLSWEFYYKGQGDIAYAHSLFKEAANIYESVFTRLDEQGLSERSRMVQPYLGLALLAMGDSQRGIKNLEEAHDYWQYRDSSRFAQTLRGLAQAKLDRGNAVQAIAYLRKALSVAEGIYVCKVHEESAAWPVWPQVCIDLGRALLAMGEMNEALQHTLAGYGKLKKWGHFLLGEGAFVAGQILTAQGKRDKAIPYLREARDEWQRLGLTHHLAA